MNVISGRNHLSRKALLAIFVFGATSSLLTVRLSLAQESAIALESTQQSMEQMAESEEVVRRTQEFVASPPSSGYWSRIVAGLKRNIVYTRDIAGVNSADVEVRTAADGAIIQTRIIKSSGTREWDEAVLRAVQKTARFPLDVYGRVPPIIILSISPT